MPYKSKDDKKKWQSAYMKRYRLKYGNRPVSSGKRVVVDSGASDEASGPFVDSVTYDYSESQT